MTTTRTAKTAEPKTNIPNRNLTFDHVDAVALKPMPGHPRKLSKMHIQRIAESIRSMGWVNPIIIDESNTIVAGVGRWQAAKLLGMTKVPTVRASGMSEADKRAYRIAENRLAEIGGWDRDALAGEFDFLFDVSFEVELTGFDAADIDALYVLPEEEEEGVGLPPQGALAVSRPGDLWYIGPHRVRCGDACDDEVVAHLLGGATADMVFADPPYNVPIGGYAAGIRKAAHREFAMASGEMSSEAYTTFLTSALTALASNCRAGAIVFVCLDWRHMTEILIASATVGLELKQLCVWAKTNAGMGSFYRSQHELIFVFKKPGAEHINNFGLGGKGRLRSNVWTYPGANGFRPGRSEDLEMHPTVKPTAMVIDAIKDCSKQKGIILDTFGGSGTTLVAAARTGRRGYPALMLLSAGLIGCIRSRSTFERPRV